MIWRKCSLGNAKSDLYQKTIASDIMRKLFVTFILLVFSILRSYSQEYHDTNFFADRNIEELGLFAGYNFNVGADHQNHIFELGIKRTYQIDPFEPYCKSVYFSNEFLWVDGEFMIGPKIGAYMSAMAITLGLESIYYTDFEGQSIHLSPYLGIGSKRARLTLNFPVNLYKNDFDYINPVTIHFSFQYAVLWSKKHGK